MFYDIRIQNGFEEKITYIISITKNIISAYIKSPPSSPVQVKVRGLNFKDFKTDQPAKFTLF